LFLSGGLGRVQLALCSGDVLGGFGLFVVAEPICFGDAKFMNEIGIFVSISFIFGGGLLYAKGYIFLVAIGRHHLNYGKDT
jgi:hypothetical protein